MENAERFARELVAVMVDAGRTPGTGMPFPALMTKFGWERNEDGKLGLAFAIERGWLEQGPGTFILLKELPPN